MSKALPTDSGELVMGVVCEAFSDSITLVNPNPSNEGLQDGRVTNFLGHLLENAVTDNGCQVSSAWKGGFKTANGVKLGVWSKIVNQPGDVQCTKVVLDQV